MRISQKAFIALAETEALQIHHYRRLKDQIESFRAHHGCTPKICSMIWNRLVAKKLLPKGFKAVHLLWTLAYLKLYCTQKVLASMVDCDDKTLRKWVNKGIHCLADLDLVRMI